MSLVAQSASIALTRAAAALFVASIGATAVAASMPQQSVTFGADRFTYEDWTSGDLETLAFALRATRSGSVELLACGPDANRTLLSAVQRLSDLPLQLQAIPASTPLCTAATAAVPLSDRVGTAIDEAAVAHYWKQVMP